MASTADNAFKGRVNETALAYYVNGSKWPDAITRRENKEKIKELNPDDVLIETGKAKEMAKSFLEKASEMGYRGVKEVYWIGVPGDTTNRLKTALDPDGKLNVDLSPQKNPTDLMVKFQTGVKGGFETWLGISAKSTGFKHGKITFKNLGLKTIDKELGLTLFNELQERTEKFVKKHGFKEGSMDRRREFEKDPKKSAIAEKEADKILEEFRDKIYSKLTRLSFDKAHEHILKAWMGASDLFPPYLKIIAAGSKAPFIIKVEDPKDNPVKTAINKNPLKFTKSGAKSIQVSAGPTKLFNINLKFDNYKMAGSIIVNGKPV